MAQPRKTLGGSRPSKNVVKLALVVNGIVIESWVVSGELGYDLSKEMARVALMGEITSELRRRGDL